MTSLVCRSQDWLGDWMGTRQDEALLDFVEDGPYEGRASDGGRFSVRYDPSTGEMAITLRCKWVRGRTEYRFHDRITGEWFPADRVRPEDVPRLTWEPRDLSMSREVVDRDWLAVKGEIESVWSRRHTFWCQRAGMERLRAVPLVRLERTTRPDDFGTSRSTSTTAPSPERPRRGTGSRTHG